MGDQRKEDDTWDFMLDHERKIGYIRITGFGRDTEEELTRPSTNSNARRCAG